MKIRPWISILLQALHVLNTCFCTSMARRHMLTKKAGWWKFEDQANVKESRQKKQTARGFSTSQTCPEPLFREQRIQGAGAKSQILPQPLHVLHWTPPVVKKVLGNHLLFSPSLASNPTSYLLSSFSVYGCSQESFGACLAPLTSGSYRIFCSCINHGFTERRWD